MSNESELRIPTRTARVMVTDTRGASLVGTVYLADARVESAEEELLALLNDDREFIPVMIEGRSQPRIISKAHLVRVQALELPADEEHESGPPHDPGIAARLSLMGNGEICGDVEVDTPPKVNRLQDKINQAPRFFRLRRDNRVDFVQKACIVELEGETNGAA